jgi:hypothetical protein
VNEVKSTLKALPWSILLALVLLWIFFVAAPDWFRSGPWWFYGAFVVVLATICAARMRRD